MDSSRQELITNAVLFLNDPKVKSSSLISRIQFLESKGLNESEIQEALSQAQSPSVAFGQAPERPRESAPSYGYTPVMGDARFGYGQAVAPEPPRRDWRDLFIMAMISGGVVYGAATLARKYLVPHLRPPSTTAFQETSTSLTAQYDEATRLLTELHTSTSELQKGIEDDRQKVDAVVSDVEEALIGLKDGEERWRVEMRDMRGEVEGIKELVPRMIEKHTKVQSSALADLQAEVRSLKTLLMSRQAPSITPSSPNTNQQGAPSPTPTTNAANALLAPRMGKASIPAWQMMPSASASGSNAESPTGSGESSPKGEE